MMDDRPTSAQENNSTASVVSRNNSIGSSTSTGGQGDSGPDKTNGATAAATGPGTTEADAASASSASNNKRTKMKSMTLEEQRAYNRENAARFRKRRKELWETLEQELREKTSLLQNERRKNRALEEQVRELVLENERLAQQQAVPQGVAPTATSNLLSLGGSLLGGAGGGSVVGPTADSLLGLRLLQQQQDQQQALRNLMLLQRLREEQQKQHVHQFQPYQHSHISPINAAGNAAGSPEPPAFLK